MQWLEIPLQELNLIINDQESIGRQFIWDGWLSMEWRQYQDQVWKQAWSRQSSKHWASEIIKKLWNIAWDMWEQRNEACHESNIIWEAIREKK